MVQAKKKTTTVAAAPPSPWPFGKKNYILFGVALAVIAVGFLLLSMNDITFAPLLLVIGYCVLIPWAIIAKDPSRTQSPVEPPPIE